MIITKFSHFHRVYESGPASTAARLGVSPTDPDFVGIKDRLARESRMGLLDWFCRRRFVDGASMDDITRVMDAITTDRNTVREMPVPVADLPSIRAFWEEMAATRDRMSLKRTMNRFLPYQKKMLAPEDPEAGYWVYWIGRRPDSLKGLRTNRQGNAAWVSDRKVLEDLSEFPGASKFFDNVRRYKDREQLLSAACSQMYLKPTTWDDTMKIVRRSGARLRYSSMESGVLIMDADFRQTQRLAAFSNWCILERKSWDTTVKNDLYVQWIVYLMDFSDRYFLIGTTTATTPIEGRFTHTESRLMSDDAIRVQDLYEILGQRGVPRDFFENAHNEVIRERITKRRSWDDIPVAVLVSAGIAGTDIARKKKSYDVKDLDHMYGEVGEAIGMDTVRKLEGQRDRLVADFRLALPVQGYHSKRRGVDVGSLRDEFDNSGPELRRRAEDVVVRMHDSKFYPLVMSGFSDYGGLEDLIDALERSGEMSA